MQAIVADTTPLNYLVLIEAVDILPRVYGRVLVPPAVKAELSDPKTPIMVSRWIAQSPSWLYVVPPCGRLPILPFCTSMLASDKPSR